MRNGHHQQQQQKRMRGRNRGNRGHNPLTRVYESNGPDVKIRGTAHHIAEKYIQLARDSQSSGDPVSSEGYLQHAEHYFRLIAAAQAQYAQQNPNQPQQAYQRPDMDADYEDGEATEGDANAQPYAGGQPVQPVQRPPYQNQPQPQPQLQPQPPFPGQPQNPGALPAFITGGGAPQQANGHDGEPSEPRSNRSERGRYGRNRNRNFRQGGGNNGSGNNEHRGGYQGEQPQANAAPAPVAPEQNQRDAQTSAPTRNDPAE